MIEFPLHNAGLDLAGKPPEELPHGLLPILLVVRELVESMRPKFRPEVFAANEENFLNDETVNWYFQGVYEEALYRRTREGPEVLAVGFDQVLALRRAMTPEEHRKLSYYPAC